MNFQRQNRDIPDAALAKMVLTGANNSEGFGKTITQFLHKSERHVNAKRTQKERKLNANRTDLVFGKCLSVFV